MAISKFVGILTAELSPTATVLADPTTEEFKTALERWTELELKTPGAIVIVSTEEDVVQTVRKALGLLHPATLLTVQVKLAAELQRFTHQY